MRDELDRFPRSSSRPGTLSGETAEVIDMLADHAAPMEMLRTAVSADSFDDPDKDVERARTPTSARRPG